MASKENELIKKIQIERSRKGARLFRNNTGSAWQGKPSHLESGDLLLRHPRRIKFGLIEGSADLIGWTPIVIEAGDIGRRVAVFTAIEVKTKGMQATPEQKNFIARVQEAGGFGEIVYAKED